MYLAATSCGMTEAGGNKAFLEKQDANGVPTLENVWPRFVKKKTNKFVQWATPSRNSAYIC